MSDQLASMFPTIYAADVRFREITAQLCEAEKSGATEAYLDSLRKQFSDAQKEICEFFADLANRPPADVDAYIAYRDAQQ